MEHLVIPLEIKSHERGVFSGYGSIFGNVDLGNDVVQPGAFTESLKELEAKGEFPSMFWNHKPDEPIGEWTKIVEDQKGLYVEGFLWVSGNAAGREPVDGANKAYNTIQAKSSKGLSIGYKTLKSSRGRVESTSVRLLEKVRPIEVSVVPHPMNPRATITSVKSLLQEDGAVADIRSFEDALRDAGLSRSQAKAFLAQGYKGLIGEQRDVDSLDIALLVDRIDAVIRSLQS